MTASYKSGLIHPDPANALPAFKPFVQQSAKCYKKRCKKNVKIQLSSLLKSLSSSEKVS
jgi:hypothetical protein